MGIPRNKKRAEAWCRGWVQPRPTRQWRISNADCNTVAIADAPVPNLGLVRRWAAAAALHPDSRSNRSTRERLTKPNAHRDSHTHADSKRIRERARRPIARNGHGLSDHAS